MLQDEIFGRPSSARGSSRPSPVADTSIATVGAPHNLLLQRLETQFWRLASLPLPISSPCGFSRKSSACDFTIFACCDRQDGHTALTSSRRVPLAYRASGTLIEMLTRCASSPSQILNDAPVVSCMWVLSFGSASLPGRPAVPIHPLMLVGIRRHYQASVLEAVGMRN